MGGKPEAVYSDDEPALSSKYTKQLFNEQHIRFITTRTHAGVAERQIRTIKDMLHKRMENSDDKDWVDHIGYVLLAYNHKMVNNSTDMTPYEAKKERSHMDAKQNLELRAKHTRKYHDINLGDKVKIYNKKKRFDKERKSVWSSDSYSVEGIEPSHGQSFYKTSASVKPCMRHEVLKFINIYYYYNIS